MYTSKITNKNKRQRLIFTYYKHIKSIRKTKTKNRNPHPLRWKIYEQTAAHDIIF